jgi:DNA (cytosine-5)-methyltransferase 1
MADSCGERCGGKEWGGEAEEKGQSERYSSERSSDSSVANSINERPQGRIQGREDSQREYINGHTGCSGSTLWSDSTIIYCRDGKYRPIPTQPEVFPLAHGISNRVGLLRGAGNAIVPQAAAEIIKAVM